MTTLNGLPISWDSFIQGICVRRKLITFGMLWEECSQEETRIVAREEKMGNEDQALIAHAKKIKRGAIITRKGSIITRIRKIILEDLAEIYLMPDAIHVMRMDTSPEIVLEIEVGPTRRRTTKEDIMLTLQRMMNLQEGESKKNILLVMMNMF